MINIIHVFDLSTLGIIYMDNNHTGLISMWGNFSTSFYFSILTSRPVRKMPVSAGGYYMEIDDR